MNNTSVNRKMKMKKIVFLLLVMLSTYSAALAQTKSPMVRIAKLKIGPAQLENYHEQQIT